MNGILAAFVILLVSGLVMYLGFKMSGKNNKKGKLVYACLVVWAAYMAFAKQFDLDPLNTVTLRTVVLSPISKFVEQYIFGMTNE
ncbi:hypothetical protein [Paenibacillus mesotrionivorans]|jgi:cytochrome b subunit of formate dehydrogenase|uniref:Uncharacterized protein n=1 Tax=Paenibacillus mesotrionivorans TaxID=3160968 RepID=A0ACC7NVZ1_9BACL